MLSVVLVGGVRPGSGNVYAYNYATGKIGPVCDDGWSYTDVSHIFASL